jgi:hypothetical protein
MAQNERPRPHGDPLRDIVKDNPAQRQSDVPPDSPARKDRTRNSDREEAADRRRTVFLPLTMTPA